MPATIEQSEWVQRVLQVDPSQTAWSVSKPSDATIRSTVKVWNDAKEVVDRQLNALYDVLRKTGIPVLGVVASEIENVMCKYRVALTKTLMEFDSSRLEGKAATRARVLKAIDVYQASLPTDKYIVAADTNPFKIQVTARATLGAALDKLRQQLAA